MSAALVTVTSLSLLGLIVATILGFQAQSAGEISQHVSLAIFSTLMILLSHSLAMFYLIGKGRAVKDAVAEGGLSINYVLGVSHVRRPVFSWGTLAVAITMAAAISGGGVDTLVLPPILHSVLAVISILLNIVTLRHELNAFTRSSAIVDAINRELRTNQ